MLVSTYQLSDTERTGARRQWVDARPVIVGRASDCDVIVDDPEVAEHHLRISVEAGGFIVEDLGGGVVVGGHPIRAATAVVEAGAIRIGNTIVKLRAHATAVVATRGFEHPGPINPPSPWIHRPAPPEPRSPPIIGNPPRPSDRPLMGNPPSIQRPARPRRKHKEILSADPVEQDFLTVLRAQPSDEATRMVYADWLEERGLTAKAELARLTEHLDTDRHRHACEIEWRAVVVRTPIEHCPKVGCPGRWDALAAVAADDFVRRCAVCTFRVSFCGAHEDVRDAGQHGSAVVFDVSIDRVMAHASYRGRLGDAIPTLDGEAAAAEPGDDLDTPRSGE